MMRLLMSILLKIRPDLINSILSFNIFFILLFSLLFLFIKDDNEEYIDYIYRHISSKCHKQKCAIRW